MPQGGGLLNTAPNPIPGGGSNPAGMNVGIPQVTPGTAMPGMATPMTGQPANKNNPLAFPANGYQTAPGGGKNPLNGLSTGWGDFPSWMTNIDPNLGADLGQELTRAFGRGTGMQLFQLLQKGYFSPEVANSLINAMQPMRTRGVNDILNAFGGAGGRFSSAAAVGMGDFESQFASTEQSTLANLFLQDQGLQQNLLQMILPTLHSENANHGGSLLNDILGGLEIAGGIAAAPFTGGASLALAGSGVSTITGGNKGGGGNSDSSGFASLGSLFNKSKDITSGIPMDPVPSGNMNAIHDIMLSGSAGQELGGADVNPSSLGIPGLLGDGSANG